MHSLAQVWASKVFVTNDERPIEKNNARIFMIYSRTRFGSLGNQLKVKNDFSRAFAFARPLDRGFEFA